jgi:hypothetical protein
MVTLSQIRLSRKMIKIVLVLAMVVSLPVAAFAARPLITDDAGTLGKGAFQVELGFETSDHRTEDDGVVTKEDASSASTTFPMASSTTWMSSWECHMSGRGSGKMAIPSTTKMALPT